MNDETAIFEDVKIGDSVYDIIFGWGKVSYVYLADFMVNFKVNFPYYNEQLVYLPTGRPSAKLSIPSRRLYWDVPQISEPPRPKRKVMKKMYINIYTDTTGLDTFSDAKVYESEAIARNNRDNPSRFPNCQTIPIIVEAIE